jgi:hypothetical protein
LALAFGIYKRLSIVQKSDTTENIYTVQMRLPTVAAASVTKTEKSFIVTAAERTKIKLLKMVKPHTSQAFFWHWHLASIRDLVLWKYQTLLKMFTTYKHSSLL